MEQLAKKYGFGSHSRIAEYIRVYENREKITEILCDASHKPIGIFKALRILKQLKTEEKPTPLPTAELNRYAWLCISVAVR